jgi:hypothetical protein
MNGLIMNKRALRKKGIRQMTLDDIKQAIDEGKEVYAETEYYRIIKNVFGRYIVQAKNGHSMGLWVNRVPQEG